MFSQPQENIKHLQLKRGMHVADLGAGTGQYARAAAKIIGDEGKVFAIEVQKDLIERLTNTNKEENFHNIEVVWGDIETPIGTRLRDGSVDAALLTNTLFQVENKDAAIGEAYRILKPEGKLLIIDWTDSHDGLGPKPDHVLPAVQAKRLFESQGFSFEHDVEAGEHHYGMIFTKS